MLKLRVTLALFCVLMLGLTFVAGDIALASPIGPGFDLFATDSASTFVELDFDGPGGLSPVPVQLEGNPLGTAGGSGPLWDTDTIVERKPPGLSPFNVGDTGVIDIELVALSLRSVDPVDIGGTLFDLDVISGSLLGEPANPLGSMTVNHSDPNGGTFSSAI
jgi:hypothetical protein